MIKELEFDAVRAEKMRMAIFYGLLAGLVFAISAWGIDCYLLARSHAYYPWAIFIIGAIPCMLLGALVSWVVYRVQNFFVAFVLWIITGYTYAWLSGHVPFTILEQFYKIVNPDLARMIDYPIVLTAQLQTGVSIVAAVIITLIGGLLEIALVDATSESSAPVGRWIPTILWVVIFFLAGMAPENNLTETIRAPIQNMNMIIQYSADHEGQTVSRQTVLDLRLKSVEPLQADWKKPRKLLLSSYDELMFNTTVLINFDGQWATCSVLDGWPSYCKYADKNSLYLH